MFDCEKEKKMDNSFSLEYFIVKHSLTGKENYFLSSWYYWIPTEWHEC